MSGPTAALVLTVVVHIIGMAVLIGMMGRDVLDVFRTSNPYSDDDGGLWDPPAPPAPDAPTGGGVPLPDADPSAVRLREPGRIAERYPRRPRRPEHEPEPQRTPEFV